MYDVGKIIVGLAVFLGLVTFPFWYNTGRAAYKTPELKLPDKSVATQCIESKEWIRENHMVLLNEWRDAVVRDGARNYVSKTYHKEFAASLQNTCMKCHDNKEEFCDKCHNSSSVTPYCWDCHIAPKKEGK